MNIKKKFLSIIFILSISILTACNPPNYSQKEAKAICKEGKTIINSYLDSTFHTKTTGTIMNVEGCLESMVEPEYYSGSEYRYLSGIVKSTFVVDNKEYEIYANTENGDIYTNYYQNEFDSAITDSIRSIFEKKEIPCALVVQDLNYTIPIVTGDKTKVYSKINGVFPVMDMNDIRSFVESLIRTGESQINCTIHCSGPEQIITVDNWKSIVEENPGIEKLIVRAYPSNYIDDYIASGELSLSASMWATEYYSLSPETYKYCKRKVFSENNIYVNGIYYEYNYSLNTTDENEYTYDITFSNKQGKTIIESTSRCENNLFFKNPTGIDQYVNIYPRYSTTNEPVKLSYIDCGEGYVTLDAIFGSQIYSFYDFISFEQK